MQPFNSIVICCLIFSIFYVYYLLVFFSYFLYLPCLFTYEYFLFCANLRFHLCIFTLLFSSVQSLSCVRLSAAPWFTARQASLSITNSWSSPRLTVHWVGDAIQPSHPLSSPSPPAPNSSQHQGLFQRVSSLHQVAEALELQLQHQSFQWIFRTDFL